MHGPALSPPADGLCGLIGMGCAAVCAGSSLYMVRAALRARAGLKEAPCSDCLVVYCCGPCAACQEARILKVGAWGAGQGWACAGLEHRAPSYRALDPTCDATLRKGISNPPDADAG